MRNLNFGDQVAIIEQKKDWCVGVLFGLWFIINFNILAVIEIFISQQEFPPHTRAGMTGIFPYIFILTFGGFVIMKIFERSLPILIELILIIAMFILSFSLSGQETDYINHFIIIPELKALCYQTVSTLINMSQFLLLPIWYIMRFMKETPHVINSRIWGIGILISIIVGSLSELIYDILKAVHLFPYII